MSREDRTEWFRAVLRGDEAANEDLDAAVAGLPPDEVVALLAAATHDLSTQALGDVVVRTLPDPRTAAAPVVAVAAAAGDPALDAGLRVVLLDYLTTARADDPEVHALLREVAGGDEPGVVRARAVRGLKTDASPAAEEVVRALLEGADGTAAAAAALVLVAWKRRGRELAPELARAPLERVRAAPQEAIRSQALVRAAAELEPQATGELVRAHVAVGDSSALAMILAAAGPWLEIDALAPVLEAALERGDAELDDAVSATIAARPSLPGELAEAGHALAYLHASALGHPFEDASWPERWRGLCARDDETGRRARSLVRLLPGHPTLDRWQRQLTTPDGEPASPQELLGRIEREAKEG